MFLNLLNRKLVVHIDCPEYLFFDEGVLMRLFFSVGFVVINKVLMLLINTLFVIGKVLINLQVDLFSDVGFLVHYLTLSLDRIISITI